MTRTRVLTASLAVLAALLVLLSTAVAGASTPGAAEPTTTARSPVGAATNPDDGRPNFVFVLVDDLDATTTPTWDAMVRTKALLKDRGLTFSNAFSPTPICCPARASILTGKYGHNTGVLTNYGDQGGWATFHDRGNEERTFATYLQDAGYRTMLVGKYLNGIEEDPEHVPAGWSEWYGAVDNAFYTGYGYTLNENGTLVDYGRDESDYATDVVAAKSVDFVARAAADGQPFMAYIAPGAPHLPIPPAPRHTDHPFSDAETPRLPNFREADVSDKPTWLQETARARSAQVSLINDWDHRNRMGSLYAVDEMVASLVSTLEAAGELDETYLVFAGDNGYQLGAHRLIQKMVPYEESLRVPLVVAGPGVRAGEEARTALVTDLAPTFLQLAGVAVPEDVDGTSLAGLLRGEAPPTWRTDFVGAYASTGQDSEDGIAQELVKGLASTFLDVPPWRALRTQTHLYAEWPQDDGSVERELYDLEADPHQLTNLVSSPEGLRTHQELVDQLTTRLDTLSRCSGASCRS